MSDGWAWETINELTLAQIRVFSEEIAEGRACERADQLELMAIAFHSTDKSIRKVIKELRGGGPGPEDIVIPV